MVFGLDHLVSEQEAEQGEIDASREWLDRQGTCLILVPHHDVGFTSDMKQRQMEYKHHGDEIVPRQQRFGQYTRSLMKGLEVPVLNQFGLRPAVVQGTDQIAPLSINKDLDELGLLNGVTTFNFHLHLPHYALTTEDASSIHVLATTAESTCPGRIHSLLREIENSIPSSGCRPMVDAAAISCLPTRQSSRLYSEAPRAWSTFGGTWPSCARILEKGRAAVGQTKSRIMSRLFGPQRATLCTSPLGCPVEFVDRQRPGPC